MRLLVLLCERMVGQDLLLDTMRSSSVSKRLWIATSITLMAHCPALLLYLTQTESLNINTTANTH